jgi:hypothetical protein
VVDYNINHQVPFEGGRLRQLWETTERCSHATLVQVVDESMEVLGCTKLAVELCDICDPIAMVWITVRCSRSFIVFVDGAYPDWAFRSRKVKIRKTKGRTRRETGILDVIKTVADSAGNEGEQVARAR